MSRAELRPWSQSTDEHEAVAWERPAPASRRAMGLHRRGGRFDVRWLAALPARWSAVPLFGALAWLGVEVIEAIAAGEFPPLSALGPALLVAAGGTILWVGRGLRDSGLNELGTAIDQVLATPGESAEPRGPEEYHAILNRVAAAIRAVEEARSAAADQVRRLMLEQRVVDLQRRQSAAILNGIGDALLVTDGFDHVVALNAAAATLLKVDAATAARQALSALGVDERIEKAVRKCREAGRSSTTRHVELSLDERVYDMALTTIDGLGDGSAGESTGVVCLLRDVTRDREVDKAKSDFVAKAAHELRTPLSSIRGYVEMLVDGEAADEKTRREYYEIIQTSSDRLGRMIDNMLNISRIEAGTSRINREPLSVAVVVKEAVDVARPQADAKKIELTAELTPVFYQVLADRDLITQAMLNLLSNAVKYTPEGGRVSVRMSVNEQQRTVTTSLSDTGAGIPEADLPRVFEKFFRVEQNKKLAKGTGLGLNLVRHIVETVHNGSVSVTSKVGEGSTFSITLPLQN